MAIVIKVALTNDKTGEVDKSFIHTIDNCYGAYQSGRSIKEFMKRIFVAVFGDDDDFW